MTVFLAVDLDAPARELAASVSSRFREALKASWVRSDKLHLTIAFLGNPGDEALREVETRTRALLLRQEPFSLHLAGAGLFETARAPSVLWLGVGGDLEALNALQHSMVKTLVGLLPPGSDGERAFVPHVTLARARHPGAFEPAHRALAEASGAPFRVDHLTLYQSTHDTYRAVARLPFGVVAGEKGAS